MRALALFILAATLQAGQPALSQEASEAACQKYGDTDLPPEASVPKPTQSPACASYKSYAGIGREVDYKAARDCAWQERAAQHADLGQNPTAPVAWVVGGSLILTDLYANGLGVPRNLPLAMRLACEQSESFVPDAVPDLEARMSDKQKAEEHFEVCDYAATTFEMNFCSAFSSEMADDQRARAVAQLAANWTDSQKSLFAAAKKAFDSYVETVGRRETYLGGTIRNIRVQGVEQGLQKEFFSELQGYEKGQLPHGSAADAQKADAQLNLVYRKAIAAATIPKNSSDKENVQADGIQATERAWLQYRDAWIEFAKLRYPATDANVWLTSLTIARTQGLKLTLCGLESKDAVCTPAILKQLQDSL